MKLDNQGHFILCRLEDHSHSTFCSIEQWVLNVGAILHIVYWWMRLDGQGHSTFSFCPLECEFPQYTCGDAGSNVLAYILFETEWLKTK